MTAVINGFLHLSQADSGNIQLNLQEFNLDELIIEVIEETNLISPGYTITLEPCETITIYADRDKIDQVLINLLTNAAKYPSNTTPIIISCKFIENNIQVSIKDTEVSALSASITIRVFCSEVNILLVLLRISLM